MNTARAVSPSPATINERNQYLSFALGEDEYAIDILRVQEILCICPITPLPQTPHHVRGVMNLRGAVVPVVDMRAALGLASEEYGKFTVIMVLSIHERTIGFVVDRVSDVLSFEANAIERSPDLGGRVDASVVSGIARTQDRFVVTPDLERLVGADVGVGVA